MTKETKKGFTLVELLIVIAIIGILAGIVLVSMGNVRDRARKASLQSTLSSITTIAALCVNDGGNVSDPTAANGGGNICDDTSITDETWPDLNNIQGIPAGTFVYTTEDIDNDTIAAGEDGDSSGTLDAGERGVICNIKNSNCNIQ